MRTKIHIYKLNGRWTWTTRSKLSWEKRYPSMQEQAKANMFCLIKNSQTVEANRPTKLAFGGIGPIFAKDLKLD